MNIPRFLRTAMAAYALAGAASLLPPGGIARAQQAALPEAVNMSDPSEVFLKAYTSVQQAERFEQEGKRAPAVAKYRFAASLLEQLSQTNPNWQPLIVRYRLRNTTETIRRLEEKGTLQAATPPPATTGRRSGATVPEDDLPVPDPGFPAVGSLTPSADLLDRNVADLRTKLDRAQQELKKAQGEKKEALAAIQKEKQALVKQRDELEEQKQTLTKQRDELAGQVQDAQKKFDRTKADRDDLQGQLSKAQDRLKDVAAKGPEALQTRKELRDQVADLKRQLVRAQGDMDNIAKARQEFDERVAADGKRIAALTKERDEAAAQVELGRDAVTKIQTLQGENAGLTEKLTSAEARVVSLTEESAKRKDELAGMQKELTGLRDQVASSRDQNDRAATTITELRQQLDEGAKTLEVMKARGQTGEDFARMTKENELLRGIVMRQLKDQSRRMAARKLLTDELARLDVQSTALNAQVEELGRPTIPLTDEERALFKDPQVTIADADASTSMAVTIAQVGSGRQSATANNPGDTASPDNTASDRNAAGDPLPDDHQPRGASNRSGGPPRVNTGSTAQPLVGEELLPMAKDALDAFSRGKYTDAERIYTQLLAREPKNAYLLSNQGVVLFRQDKLKSAEVALRKALAITPDDAFCLATLGIVYYRMHRYDDALNYLTKALQRDPRNATAHNYLGITSSQKGWPEVALEEIQKAIDINPNYADAHFNIAVIYATNQPPSKTRAQEHYRLATSLGATPDPTLEKMIQN